MKYLIEILSLILLLTLYSCDNDKKQDSNSLSLLNYDNAIDISQLILKINPDTVFFENIGSAQYIAAVIRIDLFINDIYVLFNFANTWQIKDTIKDLLYVEDCEFIRIDSVDYIYILEHSFGNAFGEVTFSLNDLDNKKRYSISFSGSVNKYDKLDSISEEVKKNIKLLQYLEKKAANSKLVSKSIYDIDEPVNYETNWRILNSGLKEKLDSNKNYDYEIKIPEYSQNLFTYIEHGSEAAQVENSNYKIISYFKGSVIGYDKKNKKYLVIWVPETLYDWIEDIKFKDDNSIIFSDEQKTYDVNLKNKTIKLIG